MIIINHKNILSRDFINELFKFRDKYYPDLKIQESDNFIINMRNNNKLLDTLLDLYIKKFNCFII